MLGSVLVLGGSLLLEGRLPAMPKGKILAECCALGLWQTTAQYAFFYSAVALLTGLVAKEMVVSSLSMFYGFSLTASSGAVAAAMAGFTPLSAFSMLVFILLYVPCVAAVSTLAREMNSVKWTLFSIAWQIGCAYVVSLVVYQVGNLFF